MAATRWGDAEDELLQYLPHRAQVIYLRGLRRWMDYETGVVGRGRELSMQMFVELLEVGSQFSANNKTGRVTAKEVRVSLDQLERVGLVERLEGRRVSALVHTLVFRLPLADVDRSVKNSQGTVRAQSGHTNEGAAKRSGGAASGDGQGTVRAQSGHTSEGTHPVSGIRGVIDTSSLSSAPETRAGDDVMIPGVPVSVDQWLAWFTREHGMVINAASRYDRKVFWPLATRWCRAGVSVAQMASAVAVAQETAGAAIAYLPAYADRVLISQQAKSNERPEWARVPADDDELWPWAKRHGYPGPGQRKYYDYRQLLRGEVEKRLQDGGVDINTTVGGVV